MEGDAQRESAIGWKTEASGKTEGHAGRRRPREEGRHHACMKGELCGGLTIGWKTEASGRTEGRAGRRRPGEERGGGVMLAPLKG